MHTSLVTAGLRPAVECGIVANFAALVLSVLLAPNVLAFRITTPHHGLDPVVPLAVVNKAG